jgi:hypothetical protein
MYILSRTKFRTEYVSQDFEILSSLGKTLNQVVYDQVQVPCYEKIDFHSESSMGTLLFTLMR